MTRPKDADGGDGLQKRKRAAYILSKQSRTADTADGGGGGKGLINFHRKKKKARYEIIRRTSDLEGSLERPRQRTEHGNKPSGSIKGGKFIGSQSDC
jgi:hypothetical protein